MRWPYESTYMEMTDPVHVVGDRCLFIIHEENNVQFEVFVPQEDNDLPAYIRTLRPLREP